MSRSSASFQSFKLHKILPFQIIYYLLSELNSMILIISNKFSYNFGFFKSDGTGISQISFIYSLFNFQEKINGFSRNATKIKPIASPCVAEKI